MDKSLIKPEQSIDIQFRKVENAAFEFNAFMENTDRSLRKQAITVPDIETKKSVAKAYWDMFDVVEEFEQSFSSEDLSAYKVAFRAIVSPWLCRSYFFNRAFIKPNGYAGDYKVIDATYDLEADAGIDPTEPGIVNCLDYVISTLHSVESLWERRHWLSALLLQEQNRTGSLKVLDIACGGARYIGDFMSASEYSTDVSITLLDQDPAAIAFAERVNLKNWTENVTSICAPIKHLTSALPDQKYDVIISSGLFDYLDHETGSSMLSYLSSLLNSNGVIAMTNFHHNDQSSVAKDWGSDWPLILRDEDEVRSLFPCHLRTETLQSQNHSLIMATGRMK